MGNIIIHQGMYLKTMLRYHFTPNRMAKIKGQEIASVDEDIEKNEPSVTVSGNAN